MCPRSKKVFECDKITMEIVRQWDSATDAEKELGFFVAGSCCRKNVSKGKYVYRYEDDYDPNESFEGKHFRPVLVVDIATRKKQAFYSIEDAAKHLHYSVKAIQYSIVNRKPLGFWLYAVKYLR